jgi:hypothetical protein
MGPTTGKRDIQATSQPASAPKSSVLAGYRISVLAGYRISVLAGYRISVLAGYRISVLAGYRISVLGKYGYLVNMGTWGIWLCRSQSDGKWANTARQIARPTSTENQGLEYWGSCSSRRFSRILTHRTLVRSSPLFIQRANPSNLRKQGN